MELITDTPYNSEFPGGSDGKESACNTGDPDSTPGSGRSPGEENGNPLQYSCLENPHGWKSLVGCSPWGRKESDTTEHLITHKAQRIVAQQLLINRCLLNIYYGNILSTL